MEIRERVLGDVAVLDVSGRMVLGGDRAMDTLFRSRVNDLLAAEKPRVIINLERVTQVDTSGLTALVTSHLTAAKRGGALKLVNPTGRVRELLGITRLYMIFDVAATETQA